MILFSVFLLWLIPALAQVQRLIPHVVAKLPHEDAPFTQGLAVEGDQLYESTGLYGQSSLRRLDIATGKVLERLYLSPAVFAEGLAVFPHDIYQITWKEQRAFIYDRPTLQLKKIIFYPGDGWGLCRDTNTLWMSNGSNKLFQRELETFRILKVIDVHLESDPVSGLNDLECVGAHLYANVYEKNVVVRIDKESGEVTGVIDASNLLTPREAFFLHSSEVLNGIAYRPKTGTFFLTGKGWPWIFEVRFEPKS